jgi:hypothetical protein
MSDFIKSIWSDINNQKYLEIYLILLAVVIIFFADIFGIEISTALVEIVLAALAVLIYGMIETRRFNEKTESKLNEYANKLDIIEKEYTKVNNALSRFSQISPYLNRNDSYVSLLNAIKNSTTSIDVVSYVNLGAADTKRSQFYQALEEAIKLRKVNHQRIVWNLNQLIWLTNLIDSGWDQFNEFSVKFYQIDPKANSLTTFDLIDQKIVIFAQNWLVEGHLEIISKDVGHYFRGYFSSMWDRSEWIKERGKPADRNRLEQLINELSGR